jgi:phospholipid/cholesterol/gamma-HCH transport system substrate-binding protein
MQIAVDYHGEVRKDNTSQHFFNLQFKTRPENYYLVGFTDHDKNVVDKTVEQLNDSDGAGDQVTHTKTTYKEEKALRFNLQIARRWYFTGLRFGLFESTGGIASDFYLLSDRLRLTLEAFDFAAKDSEVRRTAHMKAYASATFFDHLYTMVGVDDPTKLDGDTGKVNKTPNYFFGAGVNFNDQDLKALFGVATLAVPK